MTLYLMLIIVPLLAVLAVVFAGARERSGYSWVQFYAKGKDAGFALKEIELLRQLARKADLEEPASLFWSVGQLDQCIGAYVRKARLTGVEQTKETQDFLSKLYTYRKKIELEQPRYKKGISNSRAISEAQRLRLLVTGVGVFEARVLMNSNQGLTISRPIGPYQPSSFSWKGRRVAVYFYRRDDAGYVFDSTVVGDVSLRMGSGLLLSHSDTLFRTQKRRSIRAKTQISAYLYIMQGDEPPEKLEVEPGLRCIIEDLSDTGYAVTIGGKAPAGLRVKAQFVLDGNTISMSGIVRSSDYSEEANRSLLHIAADPPTLPTRNRILAHVFGVSSNDDPGADFFNFDEESIAFKDSGYSSRATVSPPKTSQEEPSPDAGPSSGGEVGYGAADDIGGGGDQDSESDSGKERNFGAADPSAERGGSVENAGGNP